jgi:hypothetical protein
MFKNWEKGEKKETSLDAVKLIFFIAKVKVARTTADTRNEILSHTKDYTCTLKRQPR